MWKDRPSGPGSLGVGAKDQSNRLDRDGTSKSESGDLGLTPFPGARRGPAGRLLRPGLPLCFPSNPGAQSGVEIHSTGDGLSGFGSGSFILSNTPSCDAHTTFLF
ncbi:unnamed protein product [Rangifer tarandus platyrhynchus]|uniref:Uncharacterized protein n=1 Tax=Rangifer tarandus platyrhynchus TaxID=3082113 RepID=A0AC60A4G4_RANTA